MPLLPLLAIEPDMPKILSRLRYRSGRTEIPPDLMKKIDETVREALSLIEPCGIYEVLQISDRREDMIFLESGLILACEKLSSLLVSCEQVILMAATIGPALSTRTAQEAQERLFATAVLDAAGSELAESAMQAVQTAAMRNIPARNLTMRFSPGYAGWDLAVQPEILSLLKAERIGLSSNERHILVPEKSVTAVAGIL